MSAQIAVTAFQNECLTILEEAWQQHLQSCAQNAPTVISTFAGCGGSSLGYSMAGFRELLAVEWDDNAVETFKLNFPDVSIYHGDIAKLSVDECLQLANIEPGQLDLLDGSPPCQGFSTAGKRNMDDDRNQLFREYVRLLRGLKPKMFVMENVSGLVKGKMKLIFAEVMRELKASGYRVSCRLLNAMYFNVPQSRQRLIFIGIRDDLGIEPSHPRAESRPVTVGEAIGHLTNMEYEYSCYCDYASYMKPGDKSGNIANFPTKEQMIYRLRKDSPSRIVIGKAQNQLIHWNIDRPLQTRELAVIGSYPDGFNFIGTNSMVAKRIGNSVPPLFMRSVARHIRSEILDKHNGM